MSITFYRSHMFMNVRNQGPAAIFHESEECTPGPAMGPEPSLVFRDGLQRDRSSPGWVAWATIFDFDRRLAHTFPCQTVGWPLFPAMGGRKVRAPRKVRCRLTAGGGDPRDSATENIPPTPGGLVIGSTWAARVKWCGKSAPRRQQWRRQGKPHREQDQVGAAGTGPRPCRASFRAAARVGRARRSATDVPDEWPSPPEGGTEPGLQTVWP